MHHFFVSPNQVINETIHITGWDVNHIKNVLRMKPGDVFLVSDGQGKDYTCAIESIREEVVGNIISSDMARTELGNRFFLFQGLPKSDKMELIIQKAVELGVYEIIPVETKRCIVRLDDKKKKLKTQRYQTISESAAKQSKRNIIPEVKRIMTFKEALEYAKKLHVKLIPYENFKDMQETRKVIGTIEKGMDVGIFIGPEGGFSTEEINEAVLGEIKPVSLGKRILRTETAGLAILSVLMFMLEE